DLNNWPRMVQIAWMMYDDDGNQIDVQNHIIIPEGYRIPLASTKIHGISTERAMTEGVDLKMVLERFSESLQKTHTVVAHNISFDEKIVGAEFLRKMVAHDFFDKKQFCTMKSTANICKLPGKYGYKWPSLDELHTFLFNERFENQHDALADIIATARSFWELKKRGII
ncbi:MAG: exonuclease domain-containing protein, partial [Saprospiraceae bacterium]